MSVLQKVFGTLSRRVIINNARPLSVKLFSSEVIITYVDPIHGKIPVAGKIGDSILATAHENDIDLEGACGGELACSTCHIILDEETYEKVLKLSPKDEEEEDMLDLAWGLTDTSRLGCQIKLCKELDGIEVTIPDEAF